MSYVLGTEAVINSEVDIRPGLTLGVGLVFLANITNRHLNKLLPFLGLQTDCFFRFSGDLEGRHWTFSGIYRYHDLYDRSEFACMGIRI